MKTLIIGNGNISEINNDKYELIICCDGGVNYAFKEGIMPHYIIGDLDSASQQMVTFFEQKGVKIKQFSTHKNETDMELCIDFAIDYGASEIDIIGATGTRFDHTLANINLLIKSVEAKIKTTIIDDNNIIMLTNNNIEIKGKKGDNVSLIPLSSKVEEVTTKGLEYPLDKYNMVVGKSLGISNVMLSDTAYIYIKSGYLLIMKSID